MDKITFERSRVISFSDAVFGIAMTLLVLEIAAPSFQLLNQYGFWPLLKAKTPNFIGFVVSFFVTALYWMDYLKITRYVIRFSSRLLWVNILVLFFVVLLPFSTALYVNGILLIEPFIFYSLNLAMIAFIIFIFAQLLFHDKVNNKGFTKTIRNWYSLKMINTIFIWLLAALVAFLSLEIARFVWVLIFIFDPLINRYYKRKSQLEQDQS